MVTFVCYHCDRTLKKKQVDRHLQFECRRPAKLCCVDCRKWFTGDQHIAHTECLTEAEVVQGKLYNPKVKNKDIEKVEDINTIKWMGWKRTIRKIVKMEPTKSIHKKTLKERVFASYVKHKNEEFDQRDANVKFLKKLDKAKNLEVKGNTVTYTVVEEE